MEKNVLTNETLTKIYTNHQLVIATGYCNQTVYCLLLLIRLWPSAKILHFQFRT